MDYVIPTWNSGKTLDVCLSAIYKHGEPDDIILVDRFSTDDTLKFADKYRCRVIQSQKPLGAARYLGVQKAETEFIAFVDSDTEIHESWKKILNYNWPKDCGCIGGRIEDTVQWYEPPYKVPWGCGYLGACITKRDLYLQCPEVQNFSGGEDICFGQFLRSRGLYWYVEDIWATNHPPAHDVPYKKCTWYGSAMRRNYGIDFPLLKRIIGGAIIGINQRSPRDSYVDNMKVRFWTLMGYMFPEKYFEVKR